MTDETPYQKGMRTRVGYEDGTRECCCGTCRHQIGLTRKCGRFAEWCQFPVEDTGVCRFWEISYAGAMDTSDPEASE